MNTDRFLTRVFDKEKKEMLYPQEILTPSSSIYIDGGYKHLIGISAKGVLISYYSGITYVINIIPFGNRFIPMQCTGHRDKRRKGKLIYESDILILNITIAGKPSLFKGYVKLNGTTNLLEIEPFKIVDLWVFKYCLFSSCKIIGNGWENPDLEGLDV